MNEKILIIAPIPPPYHGVSMVTAMLLNSSEIKQRFEIFHVDTGGRRQTCEIQKFSVGNLVLTLTVYLKFIYLILKRTEIKIVYLCLSQTRIGCARDAVFLLCAKVFNKKVVMHLHGGGFRDYYDTENYFIKRLHRFLFSGKVFSIVLSDELKWIFRGLIPERNIFVVSNGAKDMQIVPWALKKTKESIQVLFLSNCAKTKGFFDVLFAVRSVVERHENVCFVFAGSWFLRSEEKQAIDYIEHSGLKHNVKLLGMVIGEEKRKLYMESDIFVLPSYNEGQPLCVLEAMSAGLPVIATDTGAIKGTIIEGEGGLIVKKKNPQDVAKALNYLLENEDVMKRMRTQNRDRYSVFFTEEIFIRNMTRVITEVLAR